MLEPLRSQHRVMLDRAIARGEIPATVDQEVVLDLFFGAAQHRLLLGHLPLTDDFISSLVDVILDGIRPRSRGQSTLGWAGRIAAASEDASGHSGCGTMRI